MTMLAPVGNAPCSPSAIANISAKPQRCANAVSTKALARRDPYPPAKSDAPQRNTAVTLNAAGASWVRGDMPDEGNMRAANKPDNGNAGVKPMD